MGLNFSSKRKFERSGKNDYYVANNYPTQYSPAPNKKSKLLIIISIVAVVLISIFALLSQINEKETVELADFYNNTQELWSEFDQFLDDYKGRIDDSVSFTFSYYRIIPFYYPDDLEERLKKIEELSNASFNTKLSKIGLTKTQLENAQEAKSLLEENLPQIKNNLLIMKNFVYGIDNELMSQLFSDEPSCVKNEYLIQLLNSDDKDLKKASENFFDVYCSVIEGYKMNSGANLEDFYSVEITQKEKDGLKYLEERIKPLDYENLEKLDYYLSTIHSERIEYDE